MEAGYATLQNNYKLVTEDNIKLKKHIDPVGNCGF